MRARIVVIPGVHRMCTGALANVRTKGVMEYLASSANGWKGSVASETYKMSSSGPAVANVDFMRRHKYQIRLAGTCSKTSSNFLTTKPRNSATHLELQVAIF